MAFADDEDVWVGAGTAEYVVETHIGGPLAVVEGQSYHLGASLAMVVGATWYGEGVASSGKKEKDEEDAASD
jgi:hypothetical protein